MNPGLNKNLCRICLDESVELDWTTTLHGYCGITYKDCFYKYTQLEYLETDPFSNMLCQICLNGLYNTHTLVLNALKSQKYFQETLCTNMIDQTTNLKIEFMTTGFETVFLEKIVAEKVSQTQCDKTSNIEPVKTKARKKPFRNNTSITAKQKKSKKSIKSLDKIMECKIGSGEESDICESYKSGKKKEIVTIEIVQHSDSSEKAILNSDISESQKKEKIAVLDDKVNQVDGKVKKKYEMKKQPKMCSICCKNALHLHEKTHMENRERTEICKICGLKFFDKRHLHSHENTHAENREKQHKCEFCTKAFYNKSSLNIHSRKHLGKMIPCSLCTKQFLRQIDLERHMSSHSATIINWEEKKRSRYFVRCKYCDKSMLSTSFKSHTAAHLNEPILKCSICSKDFFRREACVYHVKKIHKKTNEEYNDFIIQYKKNRMSHLFLEQMADIQDTDT